MRPARRLLRISGRRPMRMRVQKPASIVQLFALCLTGCAAQQTVLAPRIEVPASLQTCSPEPEPTAALQTDTDLTDWIINLRDAGQDCRSRLANVVKLLQ